ncbi:type VI secretion system-associated FHA domain protein TagH [Enterobacteriaceae bacterium 4M9]|nr:type VI secretion system-associated FHA domain protein TagH [Enterobacteriaceae bacterium 4M9]
MEQQRPSLLLRVNNSNQLQSGCEASHTFGEQGGRIGCGLHNDWRIQDSAGDVATEHFSIVWRDGAFCLQAAGTALQLNRAYVEDNIGLVRLQQGDEITSGKLSMSVFISLNGEGIYDPLRTTPESLVADYSNPLDSLLQTGPAQERGAMAAPVMETTVAGARSSDPLQALQNESLTQPGIRPIPDYAPLPAVRLRTVADPLSDNAREYAMDQEYMELPHVSGRRAVQSEAEREETAQRYVAVTPLMRGLEAPLSIQDSQRANELLEEMGRTLQATVRGLLALQRQQDALSDKHLRPLEDNPLRLNMDYDATLNVLFGEGKSPVHLSAPEAVAESLHNMRLHHQANREAIGEALAVMLDAFSPSRLMARFTQYRRSAERGEMGADWAWNMYCSYYQELASSRQQGFEKLFNEVYEQAYDRALRQGQRERDA